MRHQVSGRKLGRTTAHRRAMFRNQLASLIEHERIRTTLPKAKELRPLAEKMITQGKRGHASCPPPGAPLGRGSHADQEALRRDRAALRRASRAATPASSSSARAAATAPRWPSSSWSTGARRPPWRPRRARARSSPRRSTRDRRLAARKQTAEGSEIAPLFLLGRVRVGFAALGCVARGPGRVLDATAGRPRLADSGGS